MDNIDECRPKPQVLKLHPPREWLTSWLQEREEPDELDLECPGPDRDTKCGLLYCG